MEDGYGLRWLQVTGRHGNVVTKEKFFKTEAARARFAEKLEEKDGFIELLAFSQPRGTLH